MSIRNLAAEFIGTAFLLISVVGSGIMAETLAEGNIALALLANAIATGCALFMLITILGPISGAHFNPIVTLSQFRFSRATLPYILCQIAGAVLGVWLSHLMFELPVVQISTTDRLGTGNLIAEVIASFGLLLTIMGGIRFRPEAVPALVGFYITGAYWFTASTSFANPAVTIARGLSDTFAGIAPEGIIPFIAAQLIGMFLAKLVGRWLFSSET